MALIGGCACGAVRYEASGKSFHRTLCHCADCRRAAGAPAVAWFSVRADALTWTAGTPAIRRSSAPVQRLFCGLCGTQLAYRNDAWPDEVDVTTCSLDAPDSVLLEDHTFASERLHWMQFADGLPQYPHSRAQGPGD